MSDVPDDELLDYLTQFLTQSRLERLEQALLWRTRHLVVVLEDLFNVHNASACLRSCEAFGLQEVHAIESRNVLQVSPKIARGAGGWLEIGRHKSPRECLDALRSRGYRLVATSPEADAVPLAEYDISRKTALLFGNEHAGVSEAVRREADEVLTVPMYGLSESFNISVSVAVCVYDLTLRLRRSQTAWQLSEEDRWRLRGEWIRRAIDPRRLAHLEARFHAERRKSGGGAK